MIFNNLKQLCESDLELHEIASFNGFYFQKGKDCLKKWLDMELSDSQKSDIMNLSNNYKQFLLINENDELFNIKQLLFKIISYCDKNAKDKNDLNEYDDKRTLARAGVRMGAWIKNLIDYKFNKSTVSGSPKNAFEYLLNPRENATILSEKHRAFIVKYYLKKEYQSNDFIDDLKSIFSSSNLTVLNNDNNTYLLTTIIYKNSNDWKPVKKHSLKVLFSEVNKHFKANNNLLKITNNSKTFLWLGDLDNIIGDKIAHYEISQRTEIKSNHVFVDLHFESLNVDEQAIFSNLISNLPTNLEWIKWREYESIGYKETFKLDDIDLIENIINALEYLEENIGDNIRKIIKQNINIPDNQFPLNQILYGPPGTGKTYNTINKSISIIENKTEEIISEIPQYSSLDEIIENKENIDQFDREFKFNRWFISSVNHLNRFKKSLNLKTSTENNNKNFVIIIDEINRGNVSQIFGELITLIEESKRYGKEEALEVTLPYSKEKFSVPPNLYIIGTMNTADRSVEALDTALRRRFSFEEMLPNLNVVREKGFDDFERVKIMETINNRIEILLDRNHTLGHAYFIKEDFKSSFQNEIIPLLQEYFYNDYSKIGLVLGRGFVRENTKFNQSILADFDTKSEIEIAKSYELIPFDDISSNFEAAITTLLA
ncbi:MAG: 5-methylcytosine-specific restriction enzyme [Bacteroidota bacterium]|jgi:hypothetical protein